jgi:hypothetical protein
VYDLPVETKTKCGTRSGYVRHRSLKEDACAECKAANAKYQKTYMRDWSRRKREKIERALREAQAREAENRLDHRDHGGDLPDGGGDDRRDGRPGHDGPDREQPMSLGQLAA